MLFRIDMAAAVAAACVAILPVESPGAQQVDRSQPQETRITVDHASLYARTVGTGPLAIVLHGGPDFDQAYLLPELDRLKQTFRLVYYDQRGRGRSANDVRAADVTLASEIADLDAVRRHFGVETVVLLGHSWGTVLALEYALRYPARVAGLLLMNPAPASNSDYTSLRQAFVAKLGADMDRQREMVASAAYQAGDPETVAARYRIHFKTALVQAAHYETLMSRMRAQFIQQGSAGILLARAVEDRLMQETWQRQGYDLLPRAKSLAVPTVVIVGEQDFIPVDIARRIARAIPNARLVTVEQCGHFAYLECPEPVRAAVEDFRRRVTR